MKRRIKIVTFLYNGEKRIKIGFNYNRDLIERIRKIPNALWSETMNCWHVPYSEKMLKTLLELDRYKRC